MISEGDLFVPVIDDHHETPYSVQSELISDSREIGGSDGTRTRDLLRDGQAF
jgi:hypothetical protein